MKSATLDSLNGILPSEAETWLLRACLHSGEVARRAWAAFEERAGDPVRLFKKDRGLKRILPFLFVALRTNQVPTSPEFGTYLKLAYLYEKQRSKAYRRVCNELLSRLHTEGVSCIVLKGAALGEGLYCDPALRHSHDLELLVRSGDLERAAEALTRLQLARKNGPRGWRETSILLTHPSGLPVELRVELFRTASWRPRSEGLWLRSKERPVAGVAARVLAPEDNLLHVCGHAAYSRSRGSLLWACDAWLLLRRAQPIEWDLLLDTARQTQVRLPLTVMLGYLACELSASIPEVVLDEFLMAAGEADTAERVTTLLATRSALGLGWGSLLRAAGSWRDRLVLLRSALFPSAEYLSRSYRLRHPALLPFLYLYRPARYSYRRFRKRLALSFRDLRQKRSGPEASLDWWTDFDSNEDGVRFRRSQDRRFK